MSSRSFNRGTCQACGRIQKLPNGVLSLHGYTKQWGFLHGVCKGSHHRAFEISKDLIEKCITGSQDAIVGLQARRAELFQFTTTANSKAWRRIYVDAKYKHNTPSGYEWRLGHVDKIETEHTFPSGKVIYKSYVWVDEKLLTDPSHRPVITSKIESYEIEQDKTGKSKQDVTQVIEMLNRKYAKDVIDVEIAQHRQYIEWQRERIKNWVQKPPLPLDDAQTQLNDQAHDDLVAVGAVKGRKKYGNGTGWFKNGKYLGRDTKHALAALKKMQ